MCLRTRLSLKKLLWKRNLLYRNGVAIIFLIATQCCFAWGSAMHRMIGEIAFQNLYPEVQHQILSDLAPLDSYHGHVSFSYATTWADRIRGQDINAFNHWHYINLGFSEDGTPLYPYTNHNIVWATQQAQQVVNSSRVDPIMKAFFMNMYIHLIGDIHQPLHCANRISKAHPKGDEGGNLFGIRYGKMTSLHQLWDSGVGIRYKNLRKTAVEWQQRYPMESFGQKIQHTEIKEMAEESFSLAKDQAYRIAEFTTPDADYIQQGQETSRRQVVLAGYRLACRLNRIYEKDRPCMKS